MKYSRQSDDRWPSHCVRVAVNKRGFDGEFNRSTYGVVVYRLVVARLITRKTSLLTRKHPTVEIGEFSRHDGDRLPKNNIPRAENGKSMSQGRRYGPPYLG